MTVKFNCKHKGIHGKPEWYCEMLRINHEEMAASFADEFRFGRDEVEFEMKAGSTRVGVVRIPAGNDMVCVGVFEILSGVVV